MHTFGDVATRVCQPEQLNQPRNFHHDPGPPESERGTDSVSLRMGRAAISEPTPQHRPAACEAGGKGQPAFLPHGRDRNGTAGSRAAQDPEIVQIPDRRKPPVWWQWWAASFVILGQPTAQQHMGTLRAYMQLGPVRGGPAGFRPRPCMARRVRATAPCIRDAETKKRLVCQNVLS